MMALAVSVAVFIAVAGLIVLFGYRRYVMAGRVYENLGVSVEIPLSSERMSDSPSHRVTRAAELIGMRLPPSAKTASALQVKLLAAGFREPKAVVVLYGLKLMLMAGTALLMLLFELSSNLAPALKIFSVLIAVFAGFKLPDYFLSKRIGQRKKKLRKALPDALDLIVVCAEAGLTIDRCFRQVSQQLGIVHPELCDEFRLFTAEISAGLRRRDALENLATRTQEQEIGKFVQVLAQADRFGTSMADALRTHADYLRVRRRQEAEEKSSQVGVKLIFPIFIFIMPCMVLVTVGPAAIAIARQLGTVFGGGH